MFVPDVADDLLDQVLQGHQPSGAPVLVHHDGDVHLAPLELLHQAVHLHGFGDEIRLAQDVVEHDEVAVLPDRQQVPGVDDAHDVVPVGLVDRQAGIAGLYREVHDGFDGRLEVDRHHIRPGDHDVPNPLVRELEDGPDHLVLLLLDGALLDAHLDPKLDVLLGDLRDGRVLLGDEPPHECVQDPGEGRDQPVE